MENTKTAKVRELEKLVRDKKKILRTERHIRWNWERSPNNPNHVRYHFIVVDDKYRDMTMNSLVEKISRAGIITVSIEQVRNKTGKVAGSRMKYLLNSYDSQIRLNDFVGINKPIKRDLELKERIRSGLRLSIEQYVENEYNHSN